MIENTEDSTALGEAAQALGEVFFPQAGTRGERLRGLTAWQRLTDRQQEKARAGARVVLRIALGRLAPSGALALRELGEEEEAR